ncbi:MAG: ParA family protein [Sphingomonadaceae bacterium]
MKGIAVFSIKGGVGKSTASVNLAHAAASSGGRRTLLWDLDSQGASTYLLPADGEGRGKARRAIAGDRPLTELIERTPYANLDLLPADRSLRRLEGDLAAADHGKVMKKHLKALEPLYDRVIIDCPPGLSELADRLFRAVDLVLVPSLPAPLSLAAEAQVAAELDRIGKARPPMLAFWSMVDRRRALHRKTVDGAPARPAIPYAAAVEAMSVARAPIAVSSPRSAASRAYASLWSAVELALLRG